MPETITVDEALKKGRKMVHGIYNIALFCTAVIVLGLFFCSEEHLPVIFHSEPILLIMISVAAIIVLPTICNNIAITQWKLWAFERVENVHDLYEQARNWHIINKQGGFFEKLEVLTPKQKQRWRLVEAKLAQPYPFDDGVTVPAETLIYFRKEWERNRLILLVVFFLGLVIFTIVTGNFVVGVIGSVIIYYVGKDHYDAYKNNDVQIKMNDKGMLTDKTPFFSWDEISDLKTEVHSVRGSMTINLTYNCPCGEREIEITNLGIRGDKLLQLAEVYRSRYETEKARESTS